MKLIVDGTPKEIRAFLDGEQDTSIHEAILHAIDEGVTVNRQILRDQRRATRATRALNRRTIQTDWDEEETDEETDVSEAELAREASWQ